MAAVGAVACLDGCGPAGRPPASQNSPGATAIGVMPAHRTWPIVVGSVQPVAPGQQPTLPRPVTLPPHGYPVGIFANGLLVHTPTALAWRTWTGRLIPLLREPGNLGEAWRVAAMGTSPWVLLGQSAQHGGAWTNLVWWNMATGYLAAASLANLRACSQMGRRSWSWADRGPASTGRAVAWMPCRIPSWGLSPQARMSLAPGTGNGDSTICHPVGFGR